MFRVSLIILILCAMVWWAEYQSFKQRSEWECEDEAADRWRRWLECAGGGDD